MRTATLLTLLLLVLPASADPPAWRFVDTTREHGLTSAPAGRAQLIDLDGDGWLDVALTGAPPNAGGAYRVYRSAPRPGGGRELWEDQRTGLQLRADGRAGRQSSMIVWGDLDGDGRLDAVSIAYQDAKTHAADPQTHAVYLAAGKGRARFKRLAADGLAREGHRATTCAVLADLDLDGKLDLALGNWYASYGKSLAAQQLRVYRGGGGGKLTDVTEAWGLLTPEPPGGPLAARPLYGLTAADLDGDGYPELIGAAYGRQANVVWRRGAGTPRYTEQAKALGVDGDAIRHGRYPVWMQTWWTKRFGKPRADEPTFRSHGNTFALVAADVDGDGDIDLFDASITHAWAGEASDLSALLINRLVETKQLTFERQLEGLKTPDPATGLAWRPTRGLHRDHPNQSAQRWNQGDIQAHFADLDNDGRLDLLVCESDYPHNRLRLWRQTEQGTFAACETAVGLDWPNCPGLALGDIDRDGDVDLLATGTRTRWPQARPRARLGLWENRPPAANGFLWLRFQGDGKTVNPDAIGARVTLVTDAGRQTREVSGPYGHWGSQTQPGEVHFGLGSATPKWIEVTWPDASRKTVSLKGFPRNAWAVIRQGQPVEVLKAFDARRWSARTLPTPVEPPH